MLILARALRTPSQLRRVLIGLFMKAICHLLTGAGVRYAMIVITDGQYGCVELTNAMTAGPPDWTTMYNDQSKPEVNKPILH